MTSNAGAYQQFDLSKAAYFDRVKEVLKLKPEHEAMLAQYGFVSVNITGPSNDDWLQPALRMEDFYYALVYQRFTSFHNNRRDFTPVPRGFRLFPKDFGGKTFYTIIENITRFWFEKSLNDYSSVQKDGSTKHWAFRNSTVYFAVALSLLQNKTATVPEELSDDVNFFLNNIWTENPKFVTLVFGFRQFKPRGHYLGSPIHERYFQTMMWYGYLPIFTYYEFKLVGTKRLNDNEWKQMLTYDNRTTYLPEWLKNIYGAGTPWPTPEFSHSHMILVLAITGTTAMALLKRAKTKKIQLNSE